MPLLPTHVIGSYGTPGWLFVVREAMKRGELGSVDICEAFDDAPNLAIMEQEEAGGDVISDGEMRRFNFLVSFYDSIAGLEKVPWDRQLGYPGLGMIDTFRAVGNLSTPNGLGLPEELEYVRKRTSKPLVTPLGGLVTFAFRINPGRVYGSKNEIAWALAPLINTEVNDPPPLAVDHLLKL